MRKKPSALILHVSTNSKCRIIIISQPIRGTDYGKATLTLNNLNKLLVKFFFG